MNPEEQALQQFEQELRNLIPAEPSETLTARIFAAFETPSDAAPAELGAKVIALPQPKSYNWVQPIAAAAVVALIAGIVALIGLSRPAGDKPEIADNDKNPATVVPVPVQPVKFVPAGAQNTYRGTEQDGLIFTEDRQPLQTVRHQFVDTYIWENPEDGSRVELQVPVERVRYIPVPTD